MTMGIENSFRGGTLSKLILQHSEKKSTPCHKFASFVPGVSCPNNNSKSPKISYTKVSDKIAYANSAPPYQTAPEGAV